MITIPIDTLVVLLIEAVCVGISLTMTFSVYKDWLRRRQGYIILKLTLGDPLLDEPRVQGLPAGWHKTLEILPGAPGPHWLVTDPENYARLVVTRPQS